MPVTQPEAEPSPVTVRRAVCARSAAPWLVLGCYLLGSLALTWRLWTDPAGLAQTGDLADVDLFAWFLRYTAIAVGHGHLPALVTTALNAPHGLNLMWNTSVLLPAVLLTPVTLLAGPQASLTVMLTLGFAGSAASLWWVLRRWGAGPVAAAAGGALYGFSPALLTASLGHYHLQFAVLPPLLADAVLRLCLAAGLVAGRPDAGRGGTGWAGSVRAGGWLGLLAAAQLLISEELLAITVIAAVVLAVLAALTGGRASWRALRHPGTGWRILGRRALAAAAGLAAAAVVVLVSCGYPLWVQFHGPLAQHGSPWQVRRFYNRPASFVVPPGTMLFHQQSTVAALARHPLRVNEYLGYLGWPLLAVLALAAIWQWRDRRVRATALTFALLELFSLGGGHGLPVPAWLLPWHWLGRLPVASQILPGRFSIVADGAAAAVVAFSLGNAWAARSGTAAEPDGAGPGRAGWLRRGLPVALAAAALVPLIPLPLHVARVEQAPAGWRAAFARLHLVPADRVLVVPPRPRQMLRWQSETGLPRSMIGGYCIAPDRAGRARGCATGHTPTARYLASLWEPSGPRARPPSRARFRADLRWWRPAAVVAVTSRHSRLARYLTARLGPPACQVRQVLAWRRIRVPGGA